MKKFALSDNNPNKIKSRMFNLAPLAIAIAGASVLAQPMAFANTNQHSQITTSATSNIAHTKTYQIDAGSLSQVLSKFAGEAGITLSFSSTKLKRLTSKGLRGSYTVTQAFDHLLSATNYQAKRQQSGNYILLPRHNKIMTLATTHISTTAAERGFGPVDGYIAKRTTTGSKTDTSLVEIPQSVSIFTADRIAAIGASDLGDALSYTPGLNVSPWGDLPQYDWFYMRGFDAYSPGFYLDNMQMRNSGTWGMWLTENYALERVEVLRGPSSVLYGQGGPGGIINMISKKPSADGYNEVQLQLGNDEHKQIAGDFSGTFDDDEKWQYRFTGLAKEAKLTGKDLDNNRLFIAPSLTWQPSDATRLTLLTQFIDDDAAADSTAFPVEGTLLPNPNGKIPSSTLIGEPDFNRYQQQQWMIGYEFEHQINSDWTIVQNARYGEFDLDYRVVWAKWLTTNENDPTSPENFRQLKRTPFKSIESTRSFNIDSRIVANLAAGSWQHTLLVGVDFQRSFNDTIANYGGTLAPLDVFSPQYGNEVTLNDPYINGTSELTQAGFYLQDQIKIANRWVLSLGTRYDTANVKQRDRLTETGTSQHDGEWSHRAGLVYLADNGLAPYISYTESFSPSTTFNPATKEAFSPEKGRQYEVGLRYQPEDQNASYSIAAFDLVRQDYVTWDWGVNSGPVQTGETQVKGLEFEALLEPVSNMNLTASYSWTPTAEVNDHVDPSLVGKQANAVSEHQASLWTDYTFDIGLSLGLGMRYVGSNDGNKESAPIEVSAATFFDALISYGIENWMLQINARNLTDKTSFSGCSNAKCSFGQAREVMLTASYKW